ncbi:DUF1972 domain-containing protein [Georgenia sp. EYE_87]|uniref:DUF1972 domain-containing protein n=1 Tax=Georgenia sp. EYE_87 TaxID=2853448 RepID=UPI002004BC93|nr:DUF1972 domain-containing protein [Georgenia sp. EYE_87]MCK6210823.1 DUF1972 domain-containing protein [Georgenia sp. EYE_87]
MTHTNLSIAMIGTRGVPARYGGFETAVEEVGRRLADKGHHVRVYCRRREEKDHPTSYLGMELVTLPAARKRSLETLSHTALSVGHLLRHRVDAAFVFNAANSPLLPPIRAARIPVATHVDGLEWKRGKWGPTGKKYYRVAEALAVRWSDALIADAEGIADYYQHEFQAASDLISYGAPIVTPGSDRLGELDLTERGYHLVVARFEPENRVDRIVEGYSKSSAKRPLIVVGSAPYSDEYTALIHEKADKRRVRFLGGVWDQELLNQLYANCLTYVHGHSVGGTNPSLLRAMGAGAPCLARGVVFNREVLGDAGIFGEGVADVAARIEEAEADVDGTVQRGEACRQRARDYNWGDVASRYEDLARRLAQSGPRRDRPSGRRTGLGTRLVSEQESEPSLGQSSLKVG